MGKVRVFWQALFSYTFTGQKTRSSKCQSWDGDDRKNHPCPGYVATVFFFLFSNSKKSILSQKKKEHKKLDLSPPIPPPPIPKRGGELNVGLTRLPLWNRFWKMARRLGLRFKHHSFRNEPHLFWGGASYLCLLAKAWVTKTNTGWKDSYKYQDKNTCAFAQHPCHPM
jgi:hypothetical protein